MGNDSVIYIRTDGNSKIATGHIVRCLCIAQALEELGKKVCFLVSDDTSFNLLQDLSNSIVHETTFSFESMILKSAVYDNLELEIEELRYLLAENKPIIFIDSYYVTETYLEALKKIAIVAYMDDLRSFDYDVDLVINYDVIPPSKEEEYKKSYTKARTTLLGAQYTPLRKQFQNQRIVLKDNIKNVLITTGGSDPYHFSESMTSLLVSQNLDMNIHLVVGRLFDNFETLKILADRYPNIYLYQNVKNMAALMKQCDFAISAAGTTLYELCALGIPAISFTFANNQVIMAETFAETGAVPYAGDLRNPIDATSSTSSNETNCHICNCVLEYLNSFISDVNKRLSQHHIMLQLTTGDGAIKIAKALCSL